jgi:hypothetical protein
MFFTFSIFSQSVKEDSNKNTNSEISYNATFTGDLELIDKTFCIQKVYKTNLRVLELKFRLIYKNVSDKTIAINKYKRNFSHFDKLFRVKPDGELQIVAKLVNESFIYGLKKSAPEILNEDNFVFLSPGESYEINNLHYDSLFQQLESGNYILQNRYDTFLLGKENYYNSQTGQTEQKKFQIETDVTARLNFAIEDSDNKELNKCAEIRKDSIIGCHIATDGKKTCENTDYKIKNR